MAPDDSSGARPAPVVLRIKLRYEDVETLVQRFAPNVGKLGLFLPTKSMQPIGAEIKFELRIASDEPVMVGLGRVTSAREANPENPRAAFGLAIQLMRVTPQTRPLILKILERRRELGMPEVGVPTADDVDAARRAEGIESGPVQMPSAMPGGGLMTAPRRAKVSTIAPLAPEAPRKKRKAIHEVIESASGPVAMVTTPIEDEPVDLAAVLARARMLAANGGSLDAELDALLEVQATPIEIGIEAASAELAERLGGKAVSRRWAPPPPTAEPEPEPAPEPPPAAPEPEPEPEPIADERPHTFGPPNVEVVTEPSAPVLRQALVVDDEPDALAELDQDAATIGPSLDVTPAVPDEVHQLAESDLEDVEHTQLGEAPVDPALLEQQLDRHLSEAEAEAEADDLGFGARYAEQALGDDEIEALEIDDFEILAEADADDADLLAAHGEQDASSANIHAAPPERPSVSDFAQRLELGDDSESDLYPAPPQPASHDYRLDREERPSSLGDTLAALEDEPSYRGVPRPLYETDPSTSYTLAGDLRDDGSIDFDEPHAGFRTQHAFDQSDVIDIRPTLPPKANAAEPRYLGDTPRGAEDEELESALEALDVDLDDLAIPPPAIQQPIGRAKQPTPATAIPRPTQPTPSRPNANVIVRQTGRAPIVEATPAPMPKTPSGRVGLPRATTEDGVVIDFDDEDSR